MLWAPLIMENSTQKMASILGVLESIGLGFPTSMKILLESVQTWHACVASMHGLTCKVKKKTKRTIANMCLATLPCLNDRPSLGTHA